MNYNLKREKLKLGNVRYELRSLYNSNILIYSSFEPVDKAGQTQKPNLVEGVFSVNTPYVVNQINFTQIFIYLLLIWLLIVNPIWTYFIELTLGDYSEEQSTVLLTYLFETSLPSLSSYPVLRETLRGFIKVFVDLAVLVELLY